MKGQNDCPPYLPFFSLNNSYKIFALLPQHQCVCVCVFCVLVLNVNDSNSFNCKNNYYN